MRMCMCICFVLGTMNPNDRIQFWKTKRVFFLTPQVLANDLRNKVCPALQFKCVVVDEAHRATKERCV